MIKIVKGDLLKAKEDIICHQVNCFGVMGAGVAKQIKQKYPEVYNEYVDTCNRFDLEDLLANVQFLKSNDGKIIANLFSQMDYPDRNNCLTSYDALQQCLISLKNYCDITKKSVAIPYKMSCGIAGGDWNIVYDMICNILDDCCVTIYKLEC